VKVRVLTQVLVVDLRCHNGASLSISEGVFKVLDK